MNEGTTTQNITVLISSPVQVASQQNNHSGSKSANAPSQLTNSSASQGLNNQNIYLEQIKKIIEENKFYPAIAKMNKISGMVKTSFKINEQGHIVDFVILESAHYQLEKATGEMFEQIQKFPIPPDTYKNVLIQIPIQFEL